ncbi:MAG: hypothetical protein HC817_09165 [Saprospiraceae bacterium]|nr:hypothetical protein [Saprospiraceae bacterium]
MGPKSADRVVTVNPTPVLSSSSTAAAICSGATVSYAPTSATSGTAFSWSRALVSGITESAAKGTDNPNEVLTNTTSAPITVTYVYSLTANSCTNTQSVTVVVNPTPTITTNPTNTTRCPAANATFTAAATGATLSYQWQVSVNGGSTWSNISGEMSPTLTLSSVSLSMNGNQYRLEVKENALCPVYSTAATLTVQNPAIPLTVTVNPGNGGNMCIGIVRNISAMVNGGTMPYTYSWTSTSGGTFANQVDNAVDHTPPTSPAFYNITTNIVDANGCTANSGSSNNVVANATPTVAIATMPQTVCSGASIAPITASNTNNSVIVSSIVWTTSKDNSNVTGSVTASAPTSGVNTVTIPAGVFTNSEITQQVANVTVTATSNGGCSNSAVSCHHSTTTFDC